VGGTTQAEVPGKGDRHESVTDQGEEVADDDDESEGDSSGVSEILRGFQYETLRHRYGMCRGSSRQG